MRKLTLGNRFQDRSELECGELFFERNELICIPNIFDAFVIIYYLNPMKLICTL